MIVVNLQFPNISKTSTQLVSIELCIAMQMKFVDVCSIKDTKS